MDPNVRHTVWFVLVAAGYLVRQCCHALDHAPVPSARKLSAGVAAMHFNHLYADGDLSGPTAPDAGESVKFGANRQHVQHPRPADALYGGAWGRPLASTAATSNWRVRKPLAKPTPGSRSRINNRSMTRFSEVEIPAGLEHRELDARVAPLPTPQRPAATNVTGLAELFRSAERSRGVENFFWKYLIDSDVSASTDDEDDDDADEDGDGKGAPRKKKFHLKKKYKKFLIPLLLAYKIKFLALVPAIIGGLILLVKSAGLAGFFFALFTAVVSLKKY